MTTVESITEYKLQNGLRVLLLPDNSKQTTTVNITYLVGSRNENYGETGMAHLLEHLMFKGTPHHSNVAKELTDHGARPNGTTWVDRTNYFETFSSTDENLDWALDLEADRMVNSFIAKKDLDSEMTVVRNEFESGENSPSSILLERMLSTAFLWHNYGKSTIGARSDIENVPIDRLQAFYRNYYQPDNAVLMVAGNYDPAKTLALIQTKFGSIARPTRAIQNTYTVEPTQDGERSVTLHRSGDVAAVGVVYHIPAGSHPDAIAASVLTQALSDAPSGRLYKALVETKLASSVSAYPFAFKETGVAVFNADVPDATKAEAARTALLQTVDKAATTPPTEEEVTRARNQLLKYTELALKNSENVGLTISEYVAMGDWRLLFLQRDQLRAVTPADVARVAKIYLKPDNRTVGTFVPTKTPDRAEVPAMPNIAGMLKDYKGNDTIAAGEVFDPSVANVESRTKRTNVVGVRLALVPKKTRGETVDAVLTLHLGDEQSLMNRTFAGQFVPTLLLRGSQKHTRQQFQDEFDRLQAQVSVYGGPTQVNVSVQTVRQNLGEVMRLVLEALRQPVFPEKEVDLLKQAYIASAQQQISDPQALTFNRLQRYVEPYPVGHIYYTPTPQESIAGYTKTTRDDIRRFYEQFYGSGSGELAVVGDFDESEIQSVAKQLTDWKAKQSFTRVPRPFRAVAALTEAIETPDKANAVTGVYLPLPLRDDNSDYPALVLGNFVLGGGFINSRLATRIRQKEGISYGVGSYFYADSLDASGMLSVYGIYAPQNAGKFETATREEFARLLKDGVTTDEVEAAKKGWLQEQQVSRAQDNELARTLARRTYTNRTLAYDTNLERSIAALTPEQVNAALRKYVDPAKLVYVRAGDFAGAAKTPPSAPAAPIK